MSLTAYVISYSEPASDLCLTILQNHRIYRPISAVLFTNFGEIAEPFLSNDEHARYQLVAERIPMRYRIKVPCRIVFQALLGSNSSCRVFILLKRKPASRHKYIKGCLSSQTCLSIPPEILFLLLCLFRWDVLWCSVAACGSDPDKSLFCSYR